MGMHPGTSMESMTGSGSTTNCLVIAKTVITKSHIVHAALDIKQMGLLDFSIKPLLPEKRPPPEKP
jgi:hypothetical protein